MDNEELLAYCEMLENIVMERGVNADFMWKAKRAMEAQERLRELLQEDDNTMVHKSVVSGVLKNESE